MDVTIANYITFLESSTYIRMKDLKDKMSYN